MTVLDLVRRTLLEDNPLDVTLPLVVGVSGGPDSLCVLDCLCRLGFRPVVAHFDHHLRLESGEDARAVARMADQRGLDYAGGDGDVTGFMEREHLSVEEAARILRYRFLFSTARQIGAQAVVVGHTADDQVETVLMHLLRGAGLGGLKGMQPFGVIKTWDAEIPLARPLLSAWRSEIEDYCREQGLQPLLDATNLQVTYYRNRLRHELVPELQRYNPQIKEVISRTAEVLAGDWQVVEQAAGQAWQAVLLEASPAHCVVDRVKLAGLPVGLQRAVLRRMLAVLRPGLRDVDFESIERGVAFLSTPTRGRSLELLQGLRLAWEPDRLILAESGFRALDPGSPWVAPDTELSLAIPGVVTLAGGWRLEAEWSTPPEEFQSASPWEAWLDEDRLELPFTLRPARPGERFQPFGMQGRSQKLSDFWINAGIPRAQRCGWPLVCSAGRVVWIPGHRVAENARVTSTTRNVVHLKLNHNPA